MDINAGIQIVENAKTELRNSLQAAGLPDEVANALIKYVDQNLELAMKTFGVVTKHQSQLNQMHFQPKSVKVPKR